MTKDLRPYVPGIGILQRSYKYLQLSSVLAMEISNATQVPKHIRAGIVNYIESGVPPDSFLSSLIKNNLNDTCANADYINAAHIHSIVAWFVNYAPPACWGHDKAEEWWLERT